MLVLLPLLSHMVQLNVRTVHVRLEANSGTSNPSCIVTVTFYESNKQ